MTKQVHPAYLPRLIIDVETYSTVDLKTAGPHAYAEHQDTGVHCLAWKIVGGPVSCAGLWLPAHGGCPPTIKRHVAAGWTVVAHNWLFEWNIWHEILVPTYGFPSLDMPQMSCTMARALYHGLPASLDELGGALGLAHVKDKSQRANMLKLAKPRRMVPGGGLLSRPEWWHDDLAAGPVMLADLYRYCAADVEAEAEADSLLPDLPPDEHATFVLDGKVNQCGVAVDTDLIARMQAITDAELTRINLDLQAVTSGEVGTVNQTARLLAWLSKQGVVMSDLTKGTVAEMIVLTDPGPAKDALRLRQDGARASTAKLRSMVAAASRDGRARGLLQYYGAGRTGRWAGRRVQIQNYPRGTLKGTMTDEAIGWINRDAPGALALFPGSTMSIVSSCLRGCLTAPPGRALVSVDLAQIEARMIAWLAGQEDLLKVFAAGEDVYVYTAERVGSRDRQLGKVLVLACGFGMGPGKFQETAATYGLALSAGQAEDYVQAWRLANPKIVSFWHALDQAFRAAVGGATGLVHRVGRVWLRRTGKAVRIMLPSGRELIYQDAQVIPPDPDADGPARDSIGFMGVDGLTKKWCRQRTYGGKLAENVTQAAARDVMRDALLACDRDGLTVIGSVHDEGLIECRDVYAKVALDRALFCFRTVPAWASGLPVGAEGWHGPRYRKG